MQQNVVRLLRNCRRHVHHCRYSLILSCLPSHNVLLFLILRSVWVFNLKEWLSFFKLSDMLCWVLNIVWEPEEGSCWRGPGWDGQWSRAASQSIAKIVGLIQTTNLLQKSCIKVHFARANLRNWFPRNTKLLSHSLNTYGREDLFKAISNGYQIHPHPPGVVVQEISYARQKTSIGFWRRELRQSSATK